MRAILLFLIACPLLAQDASKPAATAAAKPADPTPEAPKKEDPAPAAAPAPAADASPLPSSESWITGYIEAGYRWRSGIGGSADTWRSLVNLGSGPKFTGTDFTILDPKHRLFERLRVRAYDWGDPWSSLHIFAEKRGVYKFLADFRQLAYFNNLPSFADPTLLIDQQSFDTKRRVGSYDLELFNGHFISPYLSYERDSSSGRAVTTFQTGGNEYAVPSLMRDTTDLFRGGFHISGNRYHVTLEEGGTIFRNDQDTYTNKLNLGDNKTPFFGQALSLGTLSQAYGVRGNSTHSKVIGTASPFSWMDLHANFLFSQPSNSLNYQQFDTGNLVVLNTLLFFTSEQYLVSATAKLPHTTADAGIEIRPFSGLRVLESWMTDRLHNSASANQVDKIVSASLTTTTLPQAYLASNYSQSETSVIGELSKSLTLRGGYRYAWGDVRDAVLPPQALTTNPSATMRRHVGLGAIMYRPSPKLSFTGELEAGQSTGEYFRTSLYNYTKVRMMGRYRLTNSLRLTGDFHYLDNRNPTNGTSYLFRSQRQTLALDWTPKGDNWTLEANYTRCAAHSEIGYLVPQLLSPALSVYRDDCHALSGFVNGTFHKVKINAGGAASWTSGSRPGSYYQPLAKVGAPLNKSVSVFAEWRYYGFAETFYAYESFRTHLLTAGLRYTR